MKRALKVVAILAGVIWLPLGVRLFHLGPFGIHPGDYVVLDRFTLTNGVRLCAIAHRTQSLTEPYEVTFYRIETNGAVYTYWMGYEDSFWWCRSIRPSKSPSVLQIRAFGSVAAIYNAEDRSLTFPDDYYHYGIQTGRLDTIYSVPSIVAQNGKTR